MFSTMKIDGGLRRKSERASRKMTSDPTTPLRKSPGMSLRRSPEKLTQGTPQKARWYGTLGKAPGSRTLKGKQHEGYGWRGNRWP